MPFFSSAHPSHSTMFASPASRPSVSREHENSSDKGEVEEGGILKIDPAERQRILRKLDWHLLPLVSTLYLLSFLWVNTCSALNVTANSILCLQRDRSNIGNAKVAGMAHDLNLVGLKYNVAAAVFFVRT